MGRTRELLQRIEQERKGLIALVMVDGVLTPEADHNRRYAARTTLQGYICWPEYPAVVKYAARKALGQEPDSLFGFYELNMLVHKHPKVSAAAALASAGLLYWMA